MIYVTSRWGISSPDELLLSYSNRQK